MDYIKKYIESYCGESIGRRNDISVPISNKILFYYNFYSFYSQKVMLALHEKHVDYEPVLVDITKGEQYTSWFLDLNPRGEVPVLQDGKMIIPDSTRIIDYLEDFAGKETPLIRVTTDFKVLKKIDSYRDLIDSLPVGFITMGSFFHADLCGKPKMPFIFPVREILKNAELNNSNNLRRLAEEHPKAKATLLYKAAIHDRKHELMHDRQEYIKILNKVDQILDEIEDELLQQTAGAWLCCEQFTIADVNLTVLLERLYCLGLENLFWAKGKRPCLEKYYERVRQRDSYKAVFPKLPEHIKFIISSQPPAVLGAASLASVALLLSIMYIFKKVVF